jgi:cyanate permease
MSARRLVVLIVLVTLLAVIARPAPAHADFMVVMAIAGAAVAVIILVGYLVIANVEEHRRGEATSIHAAQPPVVAYALAADAP